MDRLSDEWKDSPMADRPNSICRDKITSSTAGYTAKYVACNWAGKSQRVNALPTNEPVHGGLQLYEIDT